MFFGSITAPCPVIFKLRRVRLTRGFYKIRLIRD